MKSKSITTFACFVVSFAVAGLFAPNDPTTWYLWGTAIFVMSVLFNRLGIISGRQVAETPNEQNAIGKLRWFQLNLGTLLTIVAVVVILVGGEIWRRQLEDHAINNRLLMYQLNRIISRPTKMVDHWSGGGRSDDNTYDFIAGNHYWVIPAVSIPKDFLKTITTKLTLEMRKLGLEVKVYPVGCTSHTIANESSDGNRINFSNADVCGTIVLRLAVLDDQNSVGFFFIDNTQFFR